MEGWREWRGLRRWKREWSGGFGEKVIIWEFMAIVVEEMIG